MDTYFDRKEVISCKGCPLRLISMDGMYCSHPYWEQFEAYDCHIISQGDLSSFPKKCPLLVDGVEIITRIIKAK